MKDTAGILYFGKQKEKLAIIVLMRMGHKSVTLQVQINQLNIKCDYQCSCRVSQS